MKFKGGSGGTQMLPQPSQQSCDKAGILPCVCTEESKAGGGQGTGPTAQTNEVAQTYEPNKSLFNPY
jgi:hypothetical protein